MSTRRGAWVIRQVSDNGLPVDMKYNTRFVHILFQLLPINFFNWYGEKKLNAMLFSQIPVINDDLPLKILSGSVNIKPNVKEICGSTVVFDDGSMVDFVSYMDDIAAEVGVRPSLPWLFFTDYQLFKHVLWGPVTAYQYRLMGAGKWEGARKAILTQFDRMYKPLKSRKV
ncbi:hypothetical protein GOODEAATRI_009742 [Goodea atripinnis]|uniref:Flavin-containing monooxygenase n=1 Tax=Goodea atripinnis TaxID=208336 RepID=A0ABV0MGI2_9TELE